MDLASATQPTHDEKTAELFDQFDIEMKQLMGVHPVDLDDCRFLEITFEHVMLNVSMTETGIYVAHPVAAGDSVTPVRHFSPDVSIRYVVLHCMAFLLQLVADDVEDSDATPSNDDEKALALYDQFDFDMKQYMGVQPAVLDDFRVMEITFEHFSLIVSVEETGIYVSYQVAAGETMEPLGYFLPDVPIRSVVLSCMGILLQSVADDVEEPDVK
tara:strand:+ start:705 stop:1346 length:642 start_codon:yes stop_codon:yes gene_type:complete